MAGSRFPGLRVIAFADESRVVEAGLNKGPLSQPDQAALLRRDMADVVPVDLRKVGVMRSVKPVIDNYHLDVGRQVVACISAPVALTGIDRRQTFRAGQSQWLARKHCSN
jgi:hypothetical protein